MKRWVVGVWIGGVACASAPADEREIVAPAAECEGCGSTSPTDDDRYEARQEVLQAEALRKAEAFRRRLDTMRAEEEARTKGRVEEERRRRAAETQGLLAELTDSEALATAARDAASPAPPPSRPNSDVLTVPTPESRLAAAAAVDSAETPNDPPGSTLMPTAREFLEASWCVLKRQSEVIRARLAESRRSGGEPEMLGRWALAQVDTDGLTADIEADFRRRGLANEGMECRTADAPLIEATRSLVGPGAESGPGAVERGLIRLRKELERRAGLPVRK